MSPRLDGTWAAPATRRLVAVAVLCLGIGLATLPVTASAQDILTPGRPLDPATQALIEELARKAGEMSGALAPQDAAGPMLERAQAAARAAGEARGGNAGTANATTLPEALERAGAASAAMTPPGKSGAPAIAPSSVAPPSVAPSSVAPPAVARPAVAAASDRALILFVSWSMGEGALVEALRAAAADGHTRVVLRGVLPGERIGDAVRRVAPLVRDRAPGASIDFDPPAFRRAGVFSVPTIVDPASASQWRGSVALDGFRRRLAESGKTFSDQVGPETVIAEPDLEEVMKAQAAGLDFTGMRDRAYQAFWRNVALVSLPTLETGRERLVDPTVVLSVPLRDADGRELVAAGRRINTLESYPWSHRLIVFDAGDPAQMEWAVRRAGEKEATIFLTSSVDRAAGWDGWQRLVRSLGRPLYVLDQRLADRLQLLAVPSVIEQDGSALRLREIGRAELHALAGPPAVAGAQGGG
jgi:conjugal transfer pilus assembly protein TraW